MEDTAPPLMIPFLLAIPPVILGSVCSSELIQLLTCSWSLLACFCKTKSKLGRLRVGRGLLGGSPSEGALPSVQRGKGTGWDAALVGFGWGS